VHHHGYDLKLLKRLLPVGQYIAKELQRAQVERWEIQLPMVHKLIVQALLGLGYAGYLVYSEWALLQRWLVDVVDNDVDRLL
jgi:hypothetical protein